MKWENVIFLPFVGFIQWPLAALVPAALWLGYAIYECNIRVDLLLISPLLWILTIASIVQLVRRRRDGAA